MADTAKTGIIITAEDRSKGAFDSARRHVESLGSVVGSLTASFGGLSALISGLGVTSFAAVIKGGIDSAAALDDMAEKTGASVETLSGLIRVAQIGGHEIGLVEQSAIKLAKGLAEADNKSSGAARALKALGLSADDLRAMDTGEALKVVADRLYEFRDGAGKTALALDLLGKSGAQALPYLKDLAEQGALAKTVTAAQAAEAEKFQKEIGRLKVSLNEMGRSLSLTVVPALNETIENLKRGQEAGLGFWQALTGMGVRGLNESIGDAKISAYQHIVELTQDLSKLEKDRAYHAGRGDPLMAREVDSDIAKVKVKIAYFKKLQADDALARYSASYSNEGRAYGVGKKSLTGYKATDEKDKSGRDIFADLMMETSGLNKSFYEDLNALNSGYRQGRVGLDEYSAAVGRLIGKQPFAIAMAKEEKEAREAQLKVYERVADAEDHMGKAMADFAAANQQQLVGIQAEIDAIGATPEQIERIRELAQVDRDLAKAIEQVKAATAKTGDIEGEAARIYELTRQADKAKQDIGARLDAKNQALLDYNADWTNGAKKALDDYQRAAQNVAGQTEQLFSRAFQGMEDALVDFAMTGKLDFKSLADSIIADILRIQARALVAEGASQSSGLLKSAIGAVVAYFGGSSGSSGSYTDMNTSGWDTSTSAWHTGGVIGADPAPMVRSVYSGVFSGAPRYHGGGLVDGEVPIIAKKGEGVFTPEQMKAMGGDTIQINVAVDASGEKSSGGSGQMNDLGRRIGAAVRAVIADEQRPGGMLSRA